MALALQGTEHCAVVYIDDILIFSTTREEHMQHLNLVFQRLQAYAYHVRLVKCEFLQEEVEFLGHKLSREGICTAPEKVRALQEWVTPLENTRQVKSFMGLAVWYRNFIPHLASIAAPLFTLMSTRKKFQWTEEAEEAVRGIKSLVSQAPILARWEEGLPTRVITDASKVGVGGVLEQNHDEGWCPVAFWSRKLRDPETRYSATDLEWLAAVTAVTRVWYWMLEHTPFELCSDHKALEQKLSKSRHDPPLNDRQARWVEAMLKFPYTFRWIKGESNPVADALSRYPVEANTVSILPVAHVGLWQRLKLAANHDPGYAKWVAQAEQPDTTLVLIKGLVYDPEGRLMVPDNDEIRTLIISENHDALLGGHFGSRKTQELVERS